MNNQLILLQVKERLNKLASQDYDNIECWQIVEAYNKTELEFASIMSQKGEDSKSSIDIIGFLLKSVPLKGTNKKDFYESVVRPFDYMTYKRISARGIIEDCSEPRNFTVYLAEEANKDTLYADTNRRPSFAWGETFVTFIDGRFRIHTADEFKIKDADLVYYRKPLPIKIQGCFDPVTGAESPSDVESEFNDDVIQRFLIPGTIAQLAGDIESINQYQLSLQNLQRNQ